MNRRREALLTCAFAWRMAMVASAGIAGSAAAQGTIAGRVVDRGTGNGVVAATLEISGRSTITDSVGRFSFLVPQGDTLRIRVRRLGYSPYDTMVDLDTTDGQKLVFALAPLPLRLDTVSVKAAGDFPGVLLEFEERRLHGLGRYISRDELRKYDDRVLAEVVRGRMPGLAFQPRANMLWLYSRVQRGFRSGLCYTNIYLDGMPIFRVEDLRHGKEPPDFNSLFTREFDGVEYYSQPSTVPVQYRSEGAECGVLLLWTRRR